MGTCFYAATYAKVSTCAEEDCEIPVKEARELFEEAKEKILTTAKDIEEKALGKMSTAETLDLVRTKLLTLRVALFKENHGRDPTEAEVQQWRDTLREAAEEADAGVQPAAPPSKEDNTPRGKAPEPVAQVSVEPAAKKQRVAEA